MLWCRIGVAIVLTALASYPAHAQDGPSQLRQEFDSLFQQLLSDPSNRELNRRYIEVALFLNEPEAAIGALERLLFYDPEDPVINFQLGTLYLKLQSYVVAQTYFETVVAIPDAPERLRRDAEARALEAKRASEPSPFTGYLQGGLRYQTNANVAPAGIDDNTVTELATPDWNVFGLIGLNYAQPFEGGIIEGRITTYYADQFEVNRLDLGFGEIEAGPRIFLYTGETSSLSIKPYGLANGVMLGDDPYQRSLGGGVALRAAMARIVALVPYFEYRDRDYFNSDDYPDATEETGNYFTYGLDGDGEFNDSAGWFARTGFNQNDARVADNSFDEYFVDVSLRFKFNPTGGTEAGPWTLTPFGGVSFTDYEAPDPDVDPTVEREDFSWKAGASLDIPFAALFGLGVHVQYTANESNLDRFDYENFQVSSGPRLRF